MLCFRLVTILECWPTRDPDRGISLTCTRGFRSSLYVSADLVAQWRQNLNDGVYAVPGFCSSRPTAGDLACLQADYGVFYAGQFLKRHPRGETLTTWPF